MDCYYSIREYSNSLLLLLLLVEFTLGCLLPKPENRSRYPTLRTIALLDTGIMSVLVTQASTVLKAFSLLLVTQHQTCQVLEPCIQILEHEVPLRDFSQGLASTINLIRYTYIKCVVYLTSSNNHTKKRGQNYKNNT